MIPVTIFIIVQIPWERHVFMNGLYKRYIAIPSTTTTYMFVQYIHVTSTVASIYVCTKKSFSFTIQIPKYSPSSVKRRIVVSVPVNWRNEVNYVH